MKTLLSVLFAFFVAFVVVGCAGNAEVTQPSVGMHPFEGRYYGTYTRLGGAVQGTANIEIDAQGRIVMQIVDTGPLNTFNGTGECVEGFFLGSASTATGETINVSGELLRDNGIPYLNVGIAGGPFEVTFRANRTTDG